MRLVGSRWLLAALLMGTTGATPLPRTGVARDAVFANRSDRTINEIYASPSNSDDWGTDRLGDGTIEPGRSRRVDLGATRECGFDILIVYNDASREERHAVDVCRTHLLAFDAAHATAPAGAESGEHRVVLLNSDTRPIQQVLISPAESGDWGDDRLQDSLSVGATQMITYRGSCLSDMRVVFDNRSAEERRSLDLCALGGVTIMPGWTTAATLPPQAPSLAQSSPLPVTVVNHAARGVTALYISPEGTAERGSDLLGSAVLEDGAQVMVDVMRPPGTCRFAARAVYGGKVPDQDLPGLDLCRDPVVTIPPRS